MGGLSAYKNILHGAPLENMTSRTYFNYVHPIISTPKNIWNTLLGEIKLTCTLETVLPRKDRKLATQVPER